MLPPWDLHEVCKVPATEESALAVEVEEVLQTVSTRGATEAVWVPAPASPKVALLSNSASKTYLVRRARRKWQRIPGASSASSQRRSTLCLAQCPGKNVGYPIFVVTATCWWGGVGEQCGGEGEVEAGEDPVLPRAPRDPGAWWCSAPPPRKWSPLPGLLRYGSAW